MSKQTDRKAGAAVLGAGFMVSLVAAPLAGATDNPFEFTQFESGYRVAAEGACGAEKGADVIKETLTKVHGKGQGTGPKDEVGDVLYMRGMMSAMLSVEGLRAAQERFGKGKVMTGEQMRWGLENLNLTQAKLDSLGFKGVMRPISTSCQDHMGSAWARIHTWDGAKFNWSSDWYQADEQILKPLVKSAADKYAAEKKITRRDAKDCQS